MQFPLFSMEHIECASDTIPCPGAMWYFGPIAIRSMFMVKAMTFVFRLHGITNSYWRLRPVEAHKQSVLSSIAQWSKMLGAIAQEVPC